MSCSTQTERHGSSRKRQERREKHREERRKHKRAAPPAPQPATTSTPKKHQLESKPSAFPVSSTSEAQTDDLESTYIEPDNIKLESEVEPQQEYFEDNRQAGNRVDSGSQSSDLGQNQTDINTQTGLEFDTEEDSQTEDSNVESRRKKHRKEATKRQRLLRKKKTRSKYRNINSGAS